jgi:hypothetical protein
MVLGDEFKDNLVISTIQETQEKRQKKAGQGEVEQMLSSCGKWPLGSRQPLHHVDSASLQKSLEVQCGA